MPKQTMRRVAWLVVARRAWPSMGANGRLEMRRREAIQLDDTYEVPPCLRSGSLRIAVA